MPVKARQQVIKSPANLSAVKTRRPADLALHLLSQLIGFYLNFLKKKIFWTFWLYTRTVKVLEYMEHCCTRVILCDVFDILVDLLHSLCSFDSPPHLLSMSCSIDEAVVEEPQLDQNHSSVPGAEFQSAPDHLDQEQQQQQQQDRPELEDELLDLDLEDKPSHQHKQKVSCNLCFRTQDFWSKYLIKISAFLHI